MSLAELPPDLAQVLRPVVPRLSEEIVAAVGREVEEYRRPLEGPFGATVREGSEVALERFVDLIGEPAPAPPSGMYKGLGKAEFRLGRTLDSLLAAYRLGARIAWRRFSEACDAAGVESRVVYRLGEAIFSYIDELSAESAEGYAAAQTAAEGERQQRRRQLVSLLIADPPAEESVVHAAAQEAGWRLPDRLAAVTVSGPDRARVAGRLGSEVITADLDDHTVALIPDPDAPRKRAQVMRSASRGPQAEALIVLGPSVARAEAAASVRRARLAERLVTAGVIPAESPVVADDHLPTLVLHSDPRAAGDLASSLLAPLDELPDATRAKLRATLRAWLDHGGRIEEAARRLEVHPQTVRYRLRQLRGLFGGGLDDPDARFALALALRVAR
jgi:PucR C-terminal helix-turn-helix domain